MPVVGKQHFPYTEKGKKEAKKAKAKLAKKKRVLSSDGYMMA